MVCELSLTQSEGVLNIAKIIDLDTLTVGVGIGVMGMGGGSAAIVRTSSAQLYWGLG